MVEILKEWTMTMAGAIIFGSICDMLLPEGSFRKYIRLAIGLILIITIITPISALLQSPVSLPAYSDKNRAAYQQRQEMEVEQQKEIIRIYKKRLEEKMMTSIRGMFGDCPSRVDCGIETDDEKEFGMVKSVTVVLKQNENTPASNKIESLLHDDFGIKKEYITVCYTRENPK